MYYVYRKVYVFNASVKQHDYIFHDIIIIIALAFTIFTYILNTSFCHSQLFFFIWKLEKHGIQQVIKIINLTLKCI